MASKSQEARLAQKADLERLLKERVKALTEDGFKKENINKDRVVKRIKADIHKSGIRLRAIEAKGRLNRELVEYKQKKEEEKKAAKSTEKEKKGKKADADAAVSKRQQKKKEKLVVKEKKKEQPEGPAPE